MVTTTFVDEETVIEPAWCNDVDALIYQGDLAVALNLGSTAVTSSGDSASVGYRTSNGLELTGQGSTYDVSLINDTNTVAAGVPAGTTNFKVVGTLLVSGTTTLTNPLTCSANVIVDNTTQSTSGTTGSVQTDGGIGAVKDIATDGNFIGGTFPVTKYTSADVTRTSTTTLADDASLAGWTMVAASQYSIKGFLMIRSTSATPDFKYIFDFDNAATGQHWFTSIDSSSNTGGDSNNGLGGALVIALAASGFTGVNINAIVTTHATLSATMDFQWAQNTSNGTGTTLYKGSWMEVSKLS